MVEHFIQQMQSEFKMSLVAELTYFLGFQVKNMKDGFFVSQIKYAKNIVNKLGLKNAKLKHTHVSTNVKLTKNDQGVIVD